MTTTAIRLSGWSLLIAGVGAGIVLPHPVTTRLWTAAGKLFALAGDHGMVARLTSATKFGPEDSARPEHPSAAPCGRGGGGVLAIPPPFFPAKAGTQIHPESLGMIRDTPRPGDQGWRVRSGPRPSPGKRI
jgi:hypothetical protein